ncbi:MAG: DUF4105 domain-containing protein [Woeseiaceae bacterium]
MFTACSWLAISSVLAESITSDAAWLKLLHYENKLTGLRSAVKAPAFFLSPDGGTNPDAELNATLVAMKTVPDVAEPDAHPQCRFPARAMYLRRRGLLASEPFACPAFDAWMFEGKPESLSIVLATGYLGNPASYYGHTLLKFNSPDAARTSDLLDVTVNYGAIIPPGTGPLTYMAKGALGGFDAGFSHIQYYFHDHNYGNVELRDLWEYQLDLPPEDVDYVVAHTWELLGKEFTYYFFRRNCAYRMAEALEILDDIQIIPPRRPWTVPQALVKRANESTRASKPLVKSVTYHPSRQSQFYASFAELSLRARTLVKEIVLSEMPRKSLQQLNELESGMRQYAIDALLDYYRFQTPKDAAPTDPRRTALQSALAYQFSQPPTTKRIRQTPDENPAQDVSPGYVSAAYAANNSALGDLALIRVRAAYYDALDSSVSHVANSELAMGDVTLAVKDDNIDVREAQLFRVEAVNSALSGLPGDNGKSWKLGLGVTSQDLACDDCRVARFEGDVGRSRRLSDAITGGIYIGGAVQDNRRDQGNAFARVSGYLNMTVTPSVRLRATYEHRRHLGGGLKGEDVMTLVGRWAFSNRYDIRLSARRHVASEWSLSLGYYW